VVYLLWEFTLLKWEDDGDEETSTCPEEMWRRPNLCRLQHGVDGYECLAGLSAR